MTGLNKVKDCFKIAEKDEEKGKKHKGLMLIEPNDKEAKEYLTKAKDHLEVCEYFKQTRRDYRLPEEWYYLLYLCGLAILTKFGVESRNQRCTALLLRYLKEQRMIELDDEFIDRITVHSDKDKESDVDDRQSGRYGAWMSNKEIVKRYEAMMNLCKICIEQCTAIIYSDKDLRLPNELLEKIK